MVHRLGWAAVGVACTAGVAVCWAAWTVRDLIWDQVRR